MMKGGGVSVEEMRIPTQSLMGQLQVLIGPPHLLLLLLLLAAASSSSTVRRLPRMSAYPVDEPVLYPCSPLSVLLNEWLKFVWMIMNQPIRMARGRGRSDKHKKKMNKMMQKRMRMMQVKRLSRSSSRRGYRSNAVMNLADQLNSRSHLLLPHCQCFSSCPQSSYCCLISFTPVHCARNWLTRCRYEETKD